MEITDTNRGGVVVDAGGASSPSPPQHHSRLYCTEEPVKNH